MWNRRVAVSPESALPKLVDAFSSFEESPQSAGSIWKLSERVNRAVLPLGPNLRHFTAAEGSYVAFTSCKRKHALIGHDGDHWVYREGSGRPHKGDLEDALTFLTTALECAVAGSVQTPADAFFSDLYAAGEPTAEPGELVLFDYVILNMEQLDDDEVYLEYIYVPPEARGTGAGSKTLQLVADLADKHCVTVSLEARSFRITDPYSRELDKSPGENLVSTEALVKLYSKYGFRGEARYMERLPTCAVETTQKAARYHSVGRTRTSLAFPTIPSDQPWRNVDQDVAEGWRNVLGRRFRRVGPDDFRWTKTWMSLNEIAEYANDLMFVHPVKFGLLQHATSDQVLRWAESFRPMRSSLDPDDAVTFKQRVADILKHGFSALVLIDSTILDVRTMLDGYGRYHLAMALGIDKLPVVILRDPVLPQ